ncbi:MAG: hypothetical protein R2704_04485 [Microthrixaceae bacterium]
MRIPEVIDRAVIQVRRGMGPAVVVVGAAGGAVGAVYVGLLHVLGGVLGPEHHSGPAQAAILVTVGAAVALITRVWGETGNTELLVDNIHVLGGAEDVSALRSLLPTSLLCVASRRGMGPEAPLVQTTGTIGTVVGARGGRSTDDLRVLTITGMAAGFTLLVRRAARLGPLRPRDPAAERPPVLRGPAAAVAGSLWGYAVSLGLSGLGIGSVWSFPSVGELRTVDLALAVAIGVIGALGAAVFARVTRWWRRCSRWCRPRGATCSAG